jgi:Mg2+ and Co2+ transporter CorA
VDIHPPHAIRSWKDFGIQLVTITTGILIALSLEGVRESIRDRALVREARENIHREIADNMREIDDEIRGMPDRARKLDTALRFANELLKSKKTDIHQVELGLAFPTLSAASWQTAERTGALAHMDYAEVQKYAALYAFQAFLTDQHRHAIDMLSTTIGILTASEDDDPRKASQADLERLRAQVVALRSLLFVEEQMTHTASDRYKKALE